MEALTCQLPQFALMSPDRLAGLIATGRRNKDQDQVLKNVQSVLFSFQSDYTDLYEQRNRSPNTVPGPGTGPSSSPGYSKGTPRSLPGNLPLQTARPGERPQTQTLI